MIAPMNKEKVFIGIFSSTDYNKIDFDKLKSYGKYTFNMKTIKVKSKEDFLNFLN